MPIAKIVCPRRHVSIPGFSTQLASVVQSSKIKNEIVAIGETDRARGASRGSLVYNRSLFLPVDSQRCSNDHSTCNTSARTNARKNAGDRRGTAGYILNRAGESIRIAGLNTKSKSRGTLMKSRRFRFVPILALCAAPAAWPQGSNSTVRGIVRDQAQAVIPGAVLTLTNTATNVARSSTTNDSGLYAFPA
jgi:carboxypeptidase family protein